MTKKEWEEKAMMIYTIIFAPFLIFFLIYYIINRDKWEDLRARQAGFAGGGFSGGGGGFGGCGGGFGGGGGGFGGGGASGGF
jgi:hypothetical protein